MLISTLITTVVSNHESVIKLKHYENLPNQVPVLPLYCYGKVLEFMMKNTRLTKKTLDYKGALKKAELGCRGLMM